MKMTKKKMRVDVVVVDSMVELGLDNIFPFAFDLTDRRLAARCFLEKRNDAGFWESYLVIWRAVNEQYRRGEDGRLHPLRPLRIPVHIPIYL